MIIDAMSERDLLRLVQQLEDTLATPGWRVIAQALTERMEAADVALHNAAPGDAVAVTRSQTAYSCYRDAVGMAEGLQEACYRRLERYRDNEGS